ncbi:uncharacterized protein RSE6_14217 [Rhynchosporium secalis]|uniref:Uncharacterized protein n=1 Tax=Rhynchosporium secalis TaxID=38038 RepID=A0A1E1MUR6_RHYSE|nr:uncharacterized protein RSE6_14217 [Rhynchosporium secalis]
MVGSPKARPGRDADHGVPLGLTRYLVSTKSFTSVAWVAVRKRSDPTPRANRSSSNSFVFIFFG